MTDYSRPCPFERIDVYRVLDLFDVRHPAIQHAVKKLLMAGKRGPKSESQDVAEAMAALKRWREMREEEGWEM